MPARGRIAKDAVRSPELRAGAVRSPELQDGGELVASRHRDRAGLEDPHAARATRSPARPNVPESENFAVTSAAVQGLLEQTTLDEASQLGLGVDFGNEQVTLTAVAGPTGFVSVRCTEEDGSALTVNDLKLIALAVDDVTRF